MVRTNLLSPFSTSFLDGFPFEGPARRRGVPPLAVENTANGLHLRATLPGLDPATIEISIEEARLDVKGRKRTYGAVKPTADEAEGSDSEAAEALGEEVSFALRLPFRPDSAKVEARYEQGMLLLRLPRPEVDLPKRIELRVD